MVKKIIKSNNILWSLYIKVWKLQQYIGIKYFYKKYLEYLFNKANGYRLNLNKPQSLNEKIQWLKIWQRNDLIVKCVDKVTVRSFIADAIGEEYLVPIYAVYESVDNINIDSLPNSFVLKTNHSSGQVIICKDKATVDWRKTKRTLKRWLSENFFYISGEWIYKDIKPKIICEKLLDGDIVDYKFMCFHGEPEILFTCSERDKGLKVTFFDMNFNKLPFIRKYQSADNVKKPEKFQEMIRIAQTLSKDFIFVRVDFYEENERVYVGELTFHPGNGMEWFEPVEWDYKLGDLLDLSKVDKRYVCKN